MRDTDRVRNLHFHPVRKAAAHDALGDMSRHIRGRTVNFRGILAGKASAAVPAHAAVSVDNKFSACEPGIAARTADNEAPGRINKELCIVIDQFSRDRVADNELLNIGTQLTDVNVRAVLARNDHRIYAARLVCPVVLD